MKCCWHVAHIIYILLSTDHLIFYLIGVGVGFGPIRLLQQYPGAHEFASQTYRPAGLGADEKL